MYGKVQESGLTEIIPLICTSASSLEPVSSIFTSWVFSGLTLGSGCNLIAARLQATFHLLSALSPDDHRWMRAQWPCSSDDPNHPQPRLNCQCLHPAPLQPIVSSLCWTKNSQRQGHTGFSGGYTNSDTWYMSCKFFQNEFMGDCKILSTLS